MSQSEDRYKASGLLPTDTYDQQLDRLTGLPGGAHVRPVVVQTSDFYGNSVQHLVQTVRTPEEGDFVFLTAVSANGTVRHVLPPKVLATIDRQREANSTKVKRRIGRRIAQERKERGELPGFMRKKKGGKA